MKKAAKKPARRLMPKREVLRVVGDTSFPTLWQLMRRGEFPLPVIVGGLSYWFSWEIEEWMASLPRRQYKKPEADDSDTPRRGAGRRKLLATEGG